VQTNNISGEMRGAADQKINRWLTQASVAVR